MRWRLLVVAVTGMAAALAACSFEKPWETYCGHAGRCAKLDGGGGTTEIAQGTMGMSVILRGEWLANATEVTVSPEDAATVVPGWTSGDNQINLQLNVDHGAAAGTPFHLHVVWDPTRDDSQDSAPFLITNIYVGDGGIDDAGYGTPTRPYATLWYASQQSDRGDTIRLGPGQFASIFPSSTTPCDQAGNGIKPGVVVQGDPAGSSIVGAHTPGTCAFNLYDDTQVVRDLTISGFGEGIRAKDLGARVTNVTISDCDAGVMVEPAGSLQLQGVKLNANWYGLVVNGGTVVFDGGEVYDSTRTGVMQVGTGGDLLLSGVKVWSNGTDIVSITDGAGVLLAGTGARAYVDGGENVSNGYSGITVAGTSNRLTLDGLLMNGDQRYNVAVKGGTAADVTMTNTELTNAMTCIYVEPFATFNGGSPAGGGGNYIHECTDNLEDARGTVGQAITFAGTQFQDRPGDAGMAVITGNDVPLRIKITTSGNQVVFY